MTTTDLTFNTNCPSAGGPVSQSLGSPEWGNITIVDTSCSDNHATHLEYTVSGTTHNKVHVAALDVPASLMLLVITWRDGVTEQISTVPNDFRTQNDIPGSGGNPGKTEVSFEVPLAGRPARTWVVSGGTPGFRLTVTVKRKG